MVDRRSPPPPVAIGIVVGALLPDLVDKTLSWTSGVTKTSYGIAHSLFVAPLLWLVLAAVADRRGAEGRRLAGAFALAHAVHLVTDVSDPTRPERGVVVRVVLWPFASASPANYTADSSTPSSSLLRYVHQVVAGGLAPAARPPRPVTAASH